MADDMRLTAEVRTSFGKGAARKIRAANKIPAVIYGHGTEPQHVTLPGHETMLLIRKANAVLELDIAGAQQLALVKDVQKDPVRQIIEHMDLIIVRRGEKVTVDIPVHLEGESAPGTIAAQENTTVSVEAEATHIPERITVDIEGATEGTQIHASDLKLPSGSTLISDPATLIVAISTPAGGAGEDEEAEPSGDSGAAVEETGTGETTDEAAE
ncbi:50S ribosomal protein L25/general stress protein Ctc [Lysobacter korlensis]|uniref:Large ribosomal subunit protein bL25 n=1 Tax=Lysobacter korlensis TaxID=553636 RepID=A0ABV6RVP6_9GAMM